MLERQKQNWQTEQRQKQLLAYASADFGKPGYDDNVFYNNHRYKKDRQPIMRGTYTLPDPINPSSKNGHHSVAPYAYIGVKKVFEKKNNIQISDEKQHWKEVQQHNREAYLYRKYLKNRYLKMQESV